MLHFSLSKRHHTPLSGPPTGPWRRSSQAGEPGKEARLEGSQLCKLNSDGQGPCRWWGDPGLPLNGLRCVSPTWAWACLRLRNWRASAHDCEDMREYGVGERAENTSIEIEGAQRGRLIHISALPHRCPELSGRRWWGAISSWARKSDLPERRPLGRKEWPSRWESFKSPRHRINTSPVVAPPC